MNNQLVTLQFFVLKVYKKSIRCKFTKKNNANDIKSIFIALKFFYFIDIYIFYGEFGI